MNTISRSANRTLINWIGLLGVIALISYAAAVIFSPLDYPGYNWMKQAVSDLSAENAPSKMLWKQLAALYDKCTLVCLMAVCVFIKGKLNKPLRAGIYLFTLMSWIPGIGYAMFPLSDSGNAGSSGHNARLRSYSACSNAVNSIACRGNGRGL